MIDLSKPINLTSSEFTNNKYEWYERIREEQPVARAKISIMSIYMVSRYEDCVNLLKDPRVLRNRTTVTGGSRFPLPLPKFLKPLIESMIQEDDPEHRRLRGLIRRAFRPHAIELLEKSIDDYSHQLLDGLKGEKTFDVQSRYALKIPVRMIGDMMGISRSAMPQFQQVLATVTKGFTGMRLLRTLFFDLPRTIRFVQGLIEEKRRNPAQDILTGLIQAQEDNGDRLTDDEIVGMVMLIIIAGYETTVHLISNGTLTLIQHPDQLDRLRADPTLIGSAVEEILRHRGPIHGSKPGYAKEDITLHGVTIPKGKPIMPLFGAANHDPRVFVEPQKFDISRTDNKHLGFGHGVHFCLGAHLARTETKLGLMNLIDRFPNLRLAVDPTELKLQTMPGWHRYESLPVKVD